MNLDCSRVIRATITRASSFCAWLFSFQADSNPDSKSWFQRLSFRSPFRQKPRARNDQMRETLKQSTAKLLSVTGSLSTLATLLEANALSFTLLFVFQCYRTRIMMPESKRHEFQDLTRYRIENYTETLRTLWISHTSWLNVPKLVPEHLEFTSFDLSTLFSLKLPDMTGPLWDPKTKGVNVDEAHQKPATPSWLRSAVDMFK